MELGLRDKLVLVTGASQGIGRAIAIELAREGARIVAVARNEANLKSLEAELAGGPDRHTLFPMDLMEGKNPEELARRLLKKEAPSVIVHNLGGSLGVRDTFAPASDWERVWRYNLGIVIELNRLLVPAMIERRWGRVVHLSTLSTRTYLGNAAYVSAKAALDAYLKVAGREVAKHNVVFSAVSPGAIFREGRFFAKIQKEDPKAMEDYYRRHLPAGRLGTDEEIGRVVAFLASEHAAFMTGSIVAIDGGGM